MRKILMVTLLFGAFFLVGTLLSPPPQSDIQRVASETLSPSPTPLVQSGMTNCETKTGWVLMTKEGCAAYQDQWRKEQEEIAEKLKKKLEEIFGDGARGRYQAPPSSQGTDYVTYYNNTLKYFADIESCYNKAVNEVKSGDVPAMTATVKQCQDINRNARSEIDKLYYAPNLTRVSSNLGSAWGWYDYVLSGMWILGVEIADPPYDISNSLKEKDAAMVTAKSYVEGAKKEWEAANK